jgi:hypothetical protein
MTEPAEGVTVSHEAEEAALKMRAVLAGLERVMRWWRTRLESRGLATASEAGSAWMAAALGGRMVSETGIVRERLAAASVVTVMTPE